METNTLIGFVRKVKGVDSDGIETSKEEEEEEDFIRNIGHRPKIQNTYIYIIRISNIMAFIHNKQSF